MGYAQGYVVAGGHSTAWHGKELGLLGLAFLLTCGFLNLRTRVFNTAHNGLLLLILDLLQGYERA